MQGRTVIPQQFPSYNNYFPSKGQGKLKLKGGGPRGKRSGSITQTGLLAEMVGFDIVSGMLMHERAKAEQEAQDYRRGVLSDTRDVGSTAAAKALRPYQELSPEAIARQAEPKYLPTDLPYVAPLSVPDYLPKSVPDVQISPDAGVPYNQNVLVPGQDSSPAGYPTTTPRSPAAQSYPGATPGINPVGAVAPSFLTSLATLANQTLQTALNTYLAPRPSSSARFNQSPGGAAPRVGDFLPGLTPSNAPGVASQPGQSFAQALNPDLNPEPDLATNPDKCNCKKGKGPEKKKGECGQGYFKQKSDGTTEFKFWSRRRCP